VGAGGGDRDPRRRHRPILVQPPGALAGVPDWLRYCAVAAGLAVFMLTRRSIFAGVVAARSFCWPGNGGSVDCSRRVIRYSPAHKKRPRKRNELAEIIGAGLQPRLRRASAHAAEYPVRPIKLIVPYAAGGPTDVLGRMVGDYLSRDLKQPVVVENKAGAQGAIGAEAAARSEPDGYTLFFTAASIFVLNPLLYKKLPYDPREDFRLLALITDLPS
jgi:hypothetical protein